MKRIAFSALALIVAISAAWALAQQARPTVPAQPQPVGVGQAVPGSAKAGSGPGRSAGGSLWIDNRQAEDQLLRGADYRQRHGHAV